MKCEKKLTARCDDEFEGGAACIQRVREFDNQESQAHCGRDPPNSRQSTALRAFRIIDNLATTIETGSTLQEKKTHHSVLLKTVLSPPNTCVNVASMLAVADSANSASKKKAIENDVAQVGSLGDDIASLCRRHCAIRHEVGRSDCEKEAADDSKCEAELVDVADTLKRAISESEEYSEVLPDSIRLPCHRGTQL